MVPKWGRAYGVFPDSQVEEVRELQNARARVRKAFARGRLFLDWRSSTENEQNLNEIRGGLIASVHGQLEMHWQEVRAVEIVIREVAEEFGGEHPAIPSLVQEIQETTANIMEICEGLKMFAGQVELPEPGEGLLAQASGILSADP